MKALVVIAFLLTPFINSDIYENDQGCKTKLIQTMKASSTYSSRQGYGVVNFDINKDGSVSNIKAVDSQCALSRRDDGSILFKRCPFFKKSSYAAARYLKFSPPKNKFGDSCSLVNQKRVFAHHKYNVRFKDKKEFLLDDDLRDPINLSEPSGFQDPDLSFFPPVTEIPPDPNN